MSSCPPPVTCGNVFSRRNKINLSRIWPIPMMVGLSADVNSMRIWPVSVTTPFMEELLGAVTVGPMANVASLCPVNLPLVAVPSAHSVWSPMGNGLAHHLFLFS